MEHVKTILGEPAIAYIIDRIENMKTLSNEFLVLHDLHAGSVYSYLPVDMEPARICSFSRDCGVDHDICFQELQRLVQRFLSEDRSHVVIMENSSASRTDPFLASLQSNLAFFGDEVYHFLAHEHSDSNVVSTGLGEAANAWRNVGFFASLPPDTQLRKMQQLDEHIIRQLAENIEMAFVDAYDLDGYVIWERDSA